MDNSNPTQPEKQTLRSGWLELIDRFSYDWFCTFTFNVKVTPHGKLEPQYTDGLFRRWFRLINEENFGRRFREKGVGLHCFRALEYHLTGVIHYHALIGGLPRYHTLTDDDKRAVRMAAERLWCNLPGLPTLPYYALKKGQAKETLHYGKVTGWCSIFPFKPGNGAKQYLTKYVTKGGDIEAFIPLSRLPQDRSGLGVLLADASDQIKKTFLPERS